MKALFMNTTFPPSLSKPVRVRIAPSPTGDPHIGTAYIALFNAVFAKSKGGKFIVRIEDTDQNRFRKDSEALILDCLKWVGLKWDEGPDVGGPHAPYRQSDRTEIYRKHVHTLIEKKHAYRCFCTAERLDAVRKERQAHKLSGGYDRHCRELPDDVVAHKLSEHVPFTVRMKVPTAGVTSFLDLLRGEISFENETIDDQVLLKSDGFPTYHLANVVDDHLMEISHVIRGEEWITSTPKHVILYDMFGWEKPFFAHMPLLRNLDKSKISKRKNPTSILYYKRKGIRPEALRNFLSLMGWSMGDDKEIFTTQEMVSHFQLDRIALGGPVFDLQKLAWLNGQYLRKMSDADWIDHLQKELYSADRLARIVPLVKERIEKFEDWAHATDFFFSGDLSYDPAQLALMTPKGKTMADAATLLTEAMEPMEELEEWNATALQAALEKHLAQKGLKPKDVFMPLRIAVTGRKDSPPLFESMEVVGKEMVRRRVRLAVIGLLSHQEIASAANASSPSTNSNKGQSK
jgi:glutamyl-tRNA synthetase